MELSSECEKCGAAVGNNIMLHSLRCTGEKRKAEDEPEDRAENKKAFAPPEGATVVDLLDSTRTRPPPTMEERDAALARRLACEECEGDEALALSLAAGDEQESGAFSSAGGASSSSGDVMLKSHKGGMPWHRKVEWFEIQHQADVKNNGCGNFPLCFQGSTCYYTKHDSTAHGVLPRPFPGQTLTIYHKPNAKDPTPYTNRGQAIPRDDDDPRTIVAHEALRALCMPPSRLHRDHHPPHPREGLLLPT